MQNIHKNIKFLDGPILVLGASGFIGANLLKQLLLIRRDVYGVVREKKGWRLSDIPDENIVSVDIIDENLTKNLVDSIKPKTVFDCKAYGAYSFERESSLVYKTNFLSTIKLVEVLKEVGIKAYIHAGSSSEYGLNCSGPLEDAICRPNSDYAVSKLAVSNYLYFKGKLENFPCVNLRLYSVYGPLEDTARLIPSLVRRGLEGGFPPFVNSETSRDFVYIEDICNAFILAATHMQPAIYGESINIGTGISTTIAELAELSKKTFLIESDPIFSVMESRSWDTEKWFSNSRKAQTLIGWSPKVTLEEGLKRTTKWVSSLSKEQFHSGSKLKKSLHKKSISVIVACYKDEMAIPIMYRRLKDTFTNLKIDYEIIFVNDCSPDGDEAAIKAITEIDSRVIGINHSRNFGSQMAFRSGMEIATKESVVFLDGDLQDPPELIKDFYIKWNEGWDVVFGIRKHRQMSAFSGFLYKAFYRIFAKFSYIRIPHDAGDFSLIDRRVVGWLLQFKERDLFMRGIRAYVGFKQTGVEYSRPERMFGVSTNNFLKNLGWAKKGIFSFSDTPLNILTFAGVCLFISSVLISLVVVVLRVLFPEIAPRGVTTLLLGIIFFGSLNLLAISMIGEYVGKIMLEVKARPRLIRSSLIRNGKTTSLIPDGKG